MASLVKSTHRNGDTILTQREINLAYGLKDKKESILINHSILLLFCKLHIDVHVDFFHVWAHKHALNHKY